MVLRTCSFCKNHNEVEPSKGHKLKCPYGVDSHWLECSKCTRTRERQIHVAKEKKLDYNLQSQRIISSDVVRKTRRDTRMCRKCKRHGQFVVSSRKHNNDCPNKSCLCEACRTTDTRREHVRIDLKQSRIQMKSQQPFSPSMSTDSGFFSPECPAPTPDSLTESESYQAMELGNFDAFNSLPAVSLNGGNTEEILQDARMLIDQLESELPYQIDFNSFLNEQENEILSELRKLPQSVQQVLYDGCVVGSWIG